MAEIYFPDGTKLSELFGANPNLLSALTPTFSGFSINPGTNADITNEIGTGLLTTFGVTPNATECTITYELPVSRRIVLSLKWQFVTTTAEVLIKFSDDGFTWYVQYPYVNSNEYAMMGLATIAGKTKHIQVSFTQYSGGNVNLSYLFMRAY